MELYEAIKLRHSVRSYIDKKIEGDVEKELRDLITECNRDGDLNMKLYLDEPGAFSRRIAHYGKFKNVNNYIALIGPRGHDLEEKLGYYGEKIVLKAQQLGLNTCWVGLSYSKKRSKIKVEKDEKLVLVIAIGYGETNGEGHMVRGIEHLCKVDGEMPKWFEDGMFAAQYAPTALNQQKFLITLKEGNKVEAKALMGSYTKVDLGIVKYHFEIGAGNADWEWV